MESRFPTLGAAEEFYNLVDRTAGLGVLFAGRERTAPSHRVQTVRDHWLLHLILEGRGQVRIGSKAWDLGPGSVFLLGPGVAGRYASLPADPWVYTWVGFHGRESDRLLARVGLTPDQPVLEAPPDPALEGRLGGLVDLLAARAPGFSLAAEGQMLLALADLARLARLAGDRAPVDREVLAGGRSWAEVAAEFIETNHHRPIQAADVAAHVGFHPGHLRRLFRARYGTSVQAWLLQTRVERAKLLLRSTDRPVAEVARSVGFRSYEPFEKRFKAFTGQSPRDYRRGEFFT